MHAERQLVSALSEQMGWADIDLFFKRMRVPRPNFGDESFTLKDLARGYLSECSDEMLLDIASQLGLDVPSEKYEDNLTMLVDSKYC